ncbi:MAG: aldo/keto reductase, partial [Pirellulales bacterium]
RYIGISGYPMKIFREVVAQTEIDCIMSYNQYTLQNTKLVDELVPILKPRNIGVMNAGPFAARLLSNAPLPVWHKEPQFVRDAARQAAEHCQKHGVDIAKLALQFSCSNPDLTTTVAGSANPANIRRWAEWISQPIDQRLLAEVQKIFESVKNIGHKEGLPENND